MSFHHASSDIGPIVGARFLSGLLNLDDWKSLKPSGWFGFKIRWEHITDHTCAPPICEGIFSRGGRGIAPWADLALARHQKCQICDFETTLSTNDLIELFKLWSRVIPWNGHISVEYESPDHHDTLMSLKLSVPPVLTPLGYAGYLGGFIGGFKDWYIAEGGHEGPRKLQMNKPLDLEHADNVYFELVNIVKEFRETHRNSQNPYIQEALQRVDAWLKAAEKIMDDLFR